jgi:hypothetical protein
VYKIKAISIEEILANWRRKVEATRELKIQEKEDVAYSGLPDSLVAWKTQRVPMPNSLNLRMMA